MKFKLQFLAGVNLSDR